MFSFKKIKDINYARKIINKEIDAIIYMLTTNKVTEIPRNALELRVAVIAFDIFFHYSGYTTLLEDCKINKVALPELLRAILNIDDRTAYYFSTLPNFYIKLGFTEAFEQFTSRLMRFDRYNQTISYDVYVRNSDLKANEYFSEYNDNIAIRLIKFYMQQAKDMNYMLNVTPEQFLEWMPQKDKYTFVTTSADYEKLRNVMIFEIRAFLYNTYEKKFLISEKHKELISVEAIFYFLYLHHTYQTSLLDDCHLNKISIEEIVSNLNERKWRDEDIIMFSNQIKLYETLTVCDAFKQFVIRLYLVDQGKYQDFGKIIKAPDEMNNKYDDFVIPIACIIVGILSKQQDKNIIKIYLESYQLLN